jgi:hypothetical protein
MAPDKTTTAKALRKFRIDDEITAPRKGVACLAGWLADIEANC